MKVEEHMSRKRIFEIIWKSDGSDWMSSAYDISMIIVIVISLIPLAFKQEFSLFKMTEKITVAIFIGDYFLRWMTADYKFQKKGVKSFIRYPFSPMAIVDLVSILPSLSIVNTGFKLLRILRMIRALRVVRVFKAMRYSRSFEIIGDVLHSSKESLVAVCVLAGGYIIISALVIFNVEPNSFKSFFDAVYWATVSLTTVGYGDIYPVTTVGRIVTMVSSLFGVAVVALPAGIITAGYMNELEKRKEDAGDECDTEFTLREKSSSDCHE